MKDVSKTKRQLIDELEDLRRTVGDLSTPHVDQTRAKDALSIVFDAVDSTASGIIITNTEGRIAYANPSFFSMFEYTDKSEVLGKDAASLVPGGDIRRFSDVQTIVDLTKGETEEFAVQNKTGLTFVVEVSSSNVKNSQGDVVGRMASFVDVTARKQAEEERERLVERLQQALENIKTLRGLIPICAWCKSVRDDKGFWHKVEEYLREHSGAQFTHGLCPDCKEKLHSEIQQRLKEPDPA
jgi:PAS domain S-box-containing protein